MTGAAGRVAALVAAVVVGLVGCAAESGSRSQPAPRAASGTAERETGTAEATPAPPPAAATTSPVDPAGADEAWVASTCSALGEWLADADRDEDSLRGLALGGATDPEALRRKAVAVVDSSTARTRDLLTRLEAAGRPQDADLAALAAEADRVLAETVAVLERVRPGIAGLPVDDAAGFARAAAPLVGEVLVGEAELVADLTAAVERARASGATGLYATTEECRSLDDGLRLAPPPG